MIPKVSFALVVYCASLIASSYASPFANVTDSLEGRQTGCTPAAENCDGGQTCCAGLFCSLTEPHTCSSCIPSAEFCTGVPCCAGLFCGFETSTCGSCVATGRSGCNNWPCCSGLCGTDGFCH